MANKNTAGTPAKTPHQEQMNLFATPIEADTPPQAASKGGPQAGGKKAKTETGELVMEALVARSLSAVQKKDMGAAIPDLKSTDRESLRLWAEALMDQAGPKVKDKDESEDEAGRVAATKKSPKQAYFDKLASIIDSIGHVGFKSPNPIVTTKPVFVEQPPRPSIDSSALIAPGIFPRTLGYFGNSGEIRGAKLLMARVILDGRESTVLEQLVQNPGGAIEQALRPFGLTESVANNVRAAYATKVAQGLDSVPIHPLSKQIYFEAYGEDDTLIIPVAYDSAISSLWNVVTQGADVRWAAGRMTSHVGGKNPVNGGSLANDIGGAFPLWMANPPSPVSSSALLWLTKPNHKGWLYSKFSIKADDVETFASLITTEIKEANLYERQKEHHAYRWFAETICLPLLVADEIATGLMPDTIIAEGVFADYVRRNRAQPAADDLLTLLAEEVLCALVNHHKSTIELLANLTVRQMLITKIKEALE